ncbi:IclR family transcriptional regulator [Halalkaliarchaeum desulfuricum]|uniref:IclR family transcriptional regulator n=1 Tax=Halalkaliarchaeum desulfuricum TaxID=2055893 RepID=A0A343TM31_9EURY|nr:IclR family transcriptional regulator [Halalkaliarchaeum desulfuricum]AUX10153.1 IclR family transcriptional regulator [Halalkaliarchaeum desulfuricum]
MTRNGIQAIDRMFDIIEHIQYVEGAGVSTLAEDLNMAKSTIHSHLSTLERRGYVVKDDDNQYHLGLRFFALGATVRQKRTIYHHVQPLLEEIAEETNESVNYVVETDGKMVFAGIGRGKEGIRTDIHVGFCTDLHTTPEGKLLLAFLPEERRDEILDGLEFPLENRVGRASFLAELEQIREDGIAHGNVSIVDDVGTVAAPIVDNQGQFHGGIVVPVPALRFDQDRVEEIAEILRYKIGKLNINISYQDMNYRIESDLKTR